MEKRLGRDFYRQDVVSLSRALLGKIICVRGDEGLKRARIFETEAYGGANDKAAHSYNNRRTARTEVMFWDGGHVYVYLIYGMHYLFNVIANRENIPEGVMIRCARALERNLVLNGPGKVTKYLGIDRKHYGLDLTKADNIYMIDDDYPVGEIFAGKRINIDYAGEDKERLWRFYLKK